MQETKTIYNTKKRKGFSIIEVVISLAVVTIGLVSILNLMANNIRTSLDARDQVIAAQLAQEGAELALYAVGDKRITFGPGSYCLDYSYAGLPLASYGCSGVGADKPVLYKNSLSDFYQRKNSGTETKFRRKINVKENKDAAGQVVSYTFDSLVSWSGTDPTNLAACTDKCVSATVDIKK